VTDPDQPRTDPVVDRVNELTTTFMDVAAALLLAGGCGYAVWVTFGLAWGMIVTAVALMVLSALAQLRSRPRVQAYEPVEPVEMPGPSHAGNLHIAGGR
jgi:hypothetical protein